ncbi:Cof-type HAD-IIB family hydrolase [Paenibacillus paeoniae]|uniref:HAD family phosphatase n=1 Tax=Paenibacillus paeoniae TaxID=2292705 RepID=A0A371PMK2_9BACL|nr:Cof-type HAD-IIB family hydrolase [Paenibacillus paeoniae]REK77017.1 HAD family phosphatase [Paenibacillus paeoniae]
MRVSAVVLDLDGTLLQSNKQISIRNVRAVRQCHSLGIKIIFATARPPRTVNHFLPNDLLRLGSFVYYNGAYIQCSHTGTALHKPIPASLTAAVLDRCIREYPESELSLEVLDEWLSLKHMEVEMLVGVSSGPTVTPLEQLRKQAATKILVTGSFSVKPLFEEFSSLLHIVVTDQGRVVQISSREASKEQGVATICSAYGIPEEEVVVFGDDYNDVGLFTCFGWPVAMGNAIPELKQLAKEITGTNDEDGVALVLERILSETVIDDL